MVLVMLFGVIVASEAQQTDTLFTLQTGGAAISPVGVIESVPLESVTSVPNAPFSADAETEFTQVLGDGNRIERRYSSMMARDSQGRTRREEEIALVGPLAVDGPSPRLVTILDAVAGFSYTLDERAADRLSKPDLRSTSSVQATYSYAYQATSERHQDVGGRTERKWLLGTSRQDEGRDRCSRPEVLRRRRNGQQGHDRVARHASRSRA